MVESDEELVRACRAGDESAWERIVVKYQNLLFSIPRRAGLEKDLAADVLQEVFTTLFEKLDTLEKPEYLRAWLITTTRHKTIHLVQREARGRPRYIDDDESETAFQIPDRAPLADERLIRLEKANQVEAAFGQIEERCQRLLTMLYLEKDQVPYAEIAEILKIPLGSIGPTRARCLQKLLKFIPE
ncbi:MAG: sigma-70 family RNA polymerase sigma factor [Acidobacteria bacterium]|nr:sigma-70 family RNA polymerase sigma factor [Acidobacteriota bacterium]